MKIIINIKLLLNDISGSNSFPPCDIINELIDKKQEYEFIIVADRIHAMRFSKWKNVSTIVISKSIRHPMLWKWWHDVKLPAILKKNKADVFVSFNGFCSLTTPVPQCVLLHDLSFLYHTSLIKKSYLFFYKRYLPKFLQKANAIVTSSSFLKTEISALYKINPEKIDVIQAAAGEIFYPLNEKGKEEIRIKYSDGKNYFLCIATFHHTKNLITLLKAFSAFKKMQKSNWKLVLTEDLHTTNKKITESLKTYKYRDDVVLTGIVTDEELVKLIGSAYVLIDPYHWNGLDITVLNAMKCHVPVITSNTTAIQELTGGIALYADPVDHKDIADKMMMLYKDETLRSSLAEKGRAVVEKYSCTVTAEHLWQSILKAYRDSGKPLP